MRFWSSFKIKAVRTYRTSGTHWVRIYSVLRAHWAFTRCAWRVHVPIERALDAHWVGTCPLNAQWMPIESALDALLGISPLSVHWTTESALDGCALSTHACAYLARIGPLNAHWMPIECALKPHWMCIGWAFVMAVLVVTERERGHVRSVGSSLVTNLNFLAPPSSAEANMGSSKTKGSQSLTIASTLFCCCL